MADYFICPHCEAQVPLGAAACPECGSDEKTGWSENTVYDGLFLYDEEDNDEQQTGRSITSRSWAKYLVAGLAAVILLAYSAWELTWGIHWAIYWGRYLIPLAFLVVGIAYCVNRILSSVRPRKENQLYQDLLRKARGDEGLVGRLIEYERQRSPGSDRLKILQDAIDRWESDNR